MIRKAFVFLFCVVFLVAGVSAAFFTVNEEGERVKVVPGNSSQVQQASPSGQGQQKFLSKTGGIMAGVLDMGGFSLTGLPSPDSPTDAATKRYVDTSVVVENGSTEVNVSSEVPSLGDVMAEGNVANRPLAFVKGVSLGLGSYAVDGAVAIGEGSSALEENSVAVGVNSTVNVSDTFKVGSSDRSVDVNVTGDLNVEGGLSGLERNVWSFDVSLGVNRTSVQVPDPLVNESYHVSATPVGSLARVGVFNRTEDSFGLKASRSTNATVMVTR